MIKLENLNAQIDMLVKNLTISDKFKGWAIKYLHEIRQNEVKSNQDILESKQKSFSQRLKEESHDYRYFPEPDLPTLKISEIPQFSMENLKKELPELPWEKRERLKKSFGLKNEAVEIYIQDVGLGDFFQSVIINLGVEPPSELGSSTPKLADAILLASNYIISDLSGLLKEKNIPLNEMKIKPERSFLKMRHEHS